MNTPFLANDVLVGNPTMNNPRDCSGIPPGESGNILQSDGTKWNSNPFSGGGDTFIKAFKASDGTPINNSIILVADPDLKFAIGANEIWQFECVLFVSSTVNGKCSFTGPASPVIVKFGDGAELTTGNQFGSAFGDEVSFYQTSSLCMPRIFGLVKNGVNAGVVTLEVAQLSEDPSNTTVLKGSYLIAHKIG